MTQGLLGYCWHFPTLQAGSRAMNRGIFESSIRRTPTRSHLPSLLAGNMAERGLPLSGERVVGHPIRMFSAHGTFSAPNILLVGDAAGVDPALGEGIAASLDYGDLAANAVREAFQRGDFGFSDYSSALLDHPIGQWLERRADLARTLYALDTPAEDLKPILQRALFAS